jgi:hypothetical protein
MRVEIRNLPEVQTLLRNLSERELKYATIVGTNRTAYAVMQAQRAEVKTTFQGPTRFIQTGIRYEKMTTTRPYARAYWTDERNPYIEPHVEGGGRGLKKIETVYQGRGIMGRTQWMVPGSGVSVDKFGNPTRATYQKLYDAVDGFASKKKSGNWFVIPGKGVFERRGGTTVPIMYFTRAPQYRPRYKFYETAISEANRVAPQLMSESVAKAIARSLG